MLNIEIIFMTKINITKSYDNIAEWFDAHRDKSLIEKRYLDFVLSTIPKSSNILDLGCGTGEPIAKYFIEQGCKVTGVDVSHKMIRLCQSRFPAMHWIVSDMENLKLTEKFDCIVAWHSFFHLEMDSQRKIFPLFQSHLKQNGLLVFTSGLDQGEDWSEGGNPNLNGGESLYHASLSFEEYAYLLSQNGFEVLLYQRQDPNCGGATVWLAKKFK